MKRLFAITVFAVALAAAMPAAAQRKSYCQGDIADDGGRMVAWATYAPDYNAADTTMRWTPATSDGLEVTFNLPAKGAELNAQAQVILAVIAELRHAPASQNVTLTVAFDDGPVQASVAAELQRGVSYDGSVWFVEGNLVAPGDAQAAARSATFRLLGAGGVELKRWTVKLDPDANAQRGRAAFDRLLAKATEGEACFPNIMKPNWVRKPSGEAIAEVYPAAAARSGLRGTATLACHVNAEGRLLRCRLNRDLPEGNGFGEAALKLVNQFRMAPTSSGVPVAGGSVRVPVMFNPD